MIFIVFLYNLMKQLKLPKAFKDINAGPHNPIPYPIFYLYYLACSITRNLTPIISNDLANVSPAIPPPLIIIGK
jgi:hypothetical protein